MEEYPLLFHTFTKWNGLSLLEFHDSDIFTIIAVEAVYFGGILSHEASVAGGRWYPQYGQADVEDHR